MTIATQTAGRQWLVTSETVVGRVYVVRNVNGQYTCDCLGNVHRGTCKHVRLVIAQQATDETVDRLEAARTKVLGMMMTGAGR